MRAVCLMILLGFGWVAIGPLSHAGTGATLARYRREDAKLIPSDKMVLFVGSSTVELWGNRLHRDFSTVDPVGRGVSGTSYPFLIAHADQLIFKHRPVKIVVYSGDNDIASGQPPARVARNAQRLLDLIHEKMPEVPVIVISIKPSIFRWSIHERVQQANTLIAGLEAGRPWLKFLDIYDLMLERDGTPNASLYQRDGLHMTGEGYVIWAQALRPLIE